MSVLSRHIAMFEEYLFTKNAAIVVGSTIVFYYSAKLFFSYRYKQKVKSYPKDVVILHQIPRGYRIPNLSPFCLKLETWLRMNDIKYQNDLGYNFGPKGKIPYITFNGEDIGDSQFIIEYLSNKLNKGLNNGFSPKDLGTARAYFKMAEESLFWVLALARVIYEPDRKFIGANPIVAWLGKRIYLKRTQVQGYGRHTREELFKIGKDDFKALNDFLEDKKFLIGERPCNEDSAVFGIVAQFVYSENGTLNKYIMSECPRIVAYVENIKNTYWPDWDQCITYKVK